MKRWPVNDAYFWETAPFSRLLPPLAIGIICCNGHWLPAMPLWVPGAAVAACLLALVVIAFLRRPVPSAITYLSVSVAILLTGYAMSSFSDVRNDRMWFGNKIDTGAGYLARITEAPAVRDNTYKLTVSVLGVAAGKVIFTTGNAFVYVYKDTAPLAWHAGDTVLLPGKWQQIKDAGNPYEFGYARYCANNNLHYQQFLTRNDVKLFARASSSDISYTQRLHTWCMQQLDVYITDGTTKGLLQAMLLGDEVNLDPQLRESYAATGIIHIIAISGGNVTVFFVFVGYLLWWLRHKKYVWVKYLIALPLVWLYVVMAGAAPSAIRAAIMFSVVAFGVMLQKNSNPLNYLFATGFALLLAQPAWLFALGFQLSFVAVLSLILFYGPIHNLYRPGSKVMRKIWPAIVASVAAEVLTAPIVVYYFHLFPAAFIITNVVAFLFMNFVLAAGMLIIVFSFVPFVAKIIAVGATAIVVVFDKIVDALQWLNPASFYYLRLTPVELCVVFIVIAGLAIFLTRRNKVGLFSAAGALCVLMLSFCIDEWNALRQQKLVVYNMPRANYIELISGKYHSTLCSDTGNATRHDYVLKPPHTNWQCWRNDNSFKDEEIAVVGDKIVLILNHPLAYRGSFPVDYLILNYVSSDVDLSLLQRTFSPKKIIIGNIHGRRHLEQYAGVAEKQRLPLHIIASDGAFILSGF